MTPNRSKRFGPLGGYSKRWHDARTLGVTWNDLLAEGYAVLARGSLREALERAYVVSLALGVIPSLTGSYGCFYHWLNGKGAAPSPPSWWRSCSNMPKAGS